MEFKTISYVSGGFKKPPSKFFKDFLCFCININLEYDMKSSLLMDFNKHYMQYS
jgi:hypothetical protein